jgi:hypothetical protein
MATGRRGRKVDFIFADVPGRGRPDPPDDMPEDQAKVWREVVSAMPSKWFTTPHILQHYCRMVCKVAATDDVDDLAKLSATMLSFATRLRLTPQSSKHPFTAEAEVRNTPRSRPWEDE